MYIISTVFVLVSEWVKKGMDFVVEGIRPRGRPKRTWTEVGEGDMKSLKFSKEDAFVDDTGG